MSRPGNRPSGAAASFQSASKPPKRLRCLVIQMARLGDTLQSLMALRAAQQLYPELEISLVVREKFDAAVKKVPWIHHVYSMPTAHLLEPALKAGQDRNQSLIRAAQWIAPLTSEPWDLLMNWSYSESSSYLAGIIPARVKLGYSRRSDASFCSTDGWSHYMQAVIQEGVHQNIHFTDILTTQLLTALQIHLGEPDPSAGQSSVSSKRFFSLQLALADRVALDQAGFTPTRRWIGIQLGASQSQKSYSPELWGQTAALLLQRHPEIRIALLGGAEEEALAERFHRALALHAPHALKRVHSFVGKTSFDLWATIVGRCQWILSADTAAIHLASILGTRVLNLSLGDSRWAETGPYGNGHWVIGSLVSDGKPSAHSLEPRLIYAVWSYAQQEWQKSPERHFEAQGCQEAIKNARILRSKIRSTQQGGGVTYEAVFKTPMRLEDWIGMVMGHVARGWYCGWVPQIGQELTREQLSPALLREIRKYEESAEVLERICSQATATAMELKRKSRSLKSSKIMALEDQSEIRDLGKKLLDLDGLLERTGKVHPPLHAFSKMSKVLMHNLQGQSLEELSQETALSYQQLWEGVKAFREWLKHSIRLCRPVAVSPAQNKNQSI